MSAAFRAEIDRSCQRGMHVRYWLHHDPPPQLIDAIQQRWSDAVVARERLGARTITRVAVPFRFEIRVGHRDAEISLLLRFSSTEAQRAADRAAFEVLLAQLLPHGGR